MSQPPRCIHLLGICGTAMTALAGCLQALGVRVTGSDEHVYPPMSDQLASLGIPCNEGYHSRNIPSDTELVVVGNVIREINLEAMEMRRRGLPYMSMAEAVRLFAIGNRHAIAVVGTHGKTTTTSLAAHMLTDLGAEPGYLIGGIANNFSGNFALGRGDRFVIEGDEYDTAYFDKTPKFFKYKPATVIFTSLEFDHADIYPDLEAIQFHFGRLLREMPSDGLVIACSDDPNVEALLGQAACPVLRYGFGNRADFRLSRWRDGGDAVFFESRRKGAKGQWRSPLAGRHNALNAAAGIVLALEMGFDPASISSALERFQGVKRRQEVRGIAGGVTVIDDFAHHPTAVRFTIEAMRHRYPEERLWAVFEPRSFTARGNRFQEEFTRALAGADRVLLARPYSSAYSAGEETLDTRAMVERLRAQGLWAESRDSVDGLIHCVAAEAEPGDIVLIMSNGGFDDIHDRILAALRARGETSSKSA